VTCKEPYQDHVYKILYKFGKVQIHDFIHGYIRKMTMWSSILGRYTNKDSRKSLFGNFRILRRFSMDFRILKQFLAFKRIRQLKKKKQIGHWAGFGL
jgi:hypothetical protein